MISTEANVGQTLNRSCEECVCMQTICHVHIPWHAGSLIPLDWVLLHTNKNLCKLSVSCIYLSMLALYYLLLTTVGVADTFTIRLISCCADLQRAVLPVHVSLLWDLC